MWHWVIGWHNLLVISWHSNDDILNSNVLKARRLSVSPWTISSLNHRRLRLIIAEQKKKPKQTERNELSSLNSLLQFLLARIYISNRTTTCTSVKWLLLFNRKFPLRMDKNGNCGHVVSSFFAQFFSSLLLLTLVSFRRLILFGFYFCALCHCFLWQ